MKKKTQKNIKVKNLQKIVKLLTEAEALVGSPYKYGAYTQKPKDKEKEFDCSSFVQYIYSRIGVKLPRSSIFQATKGREIKEKDLVLGDLIFFEGEVGHFRHDLFPKKKIYVGHVAIYLSDNLIIHAKSDKGGVIVQKLSELQKNPLYKIVLVKRILELGDVGSYKLKPLSQFLDIKESKWKKRSCGIVSFCMLANFLVGKKVAKPDDVLKKALEFDGAYIDKVGWAHKTFAEGAKFFGLSGKAYDFFKKSDDFAFGKLVSFLEKAPVMVSVYKNLNLKNSGHLVVVSGIKNGKVQYYDPNTKDRKKVKREVDIYSFIKGWRRRFIVVNKK